LIQIKSSPNAFSSMPDVIPPPNPPSKFNRAVTILMIAAAAAVALIGAGGYTVYSNMRHTEFERGWVEHSQAVLMNLLGQSQRLDRVDYNMQLFLVTADRDNYKAASANLAAMGVSLLQLQELVRDNESQTRHTQELDKSLQQLAAAIARTGSHPGTVPDQQILTCHDGINILQQEERGLLRQRTDTFKTSSYSSFLFSIGYLGLSLFIILVLFLFLLRDTVRRRVDEFRLSATNDQLESTVSKLTERAHESALLTAARDELQLCISSAQAYESTVRHMQQLLPGSSGAALTINNSRHMVEICASWGQPTALLDGFDLNACCGLRAGKPRWRRPGHSELNCGHFIGAAPGNYLCVPIAAYGETMGVVYISFPSEGYLALAEARTELVLELVELASLSIAGLNLRAKLERQSIRDSLTGLFNRHFMEIALDRELHRATRHRTQLAVLMLDVDHFKQFNDTFGHEAGDAVLREVARCFRESVREEDIICRYGGEEFLIIMPDVKEEIALERAGQILQAIAALRINFHGETLRSVTTSIGVAMYPEVARNAEALIRVADQALYRAKHGGRNQVQIAPALSESFTGDPILA
jgi:diguanylate cyclase (GGDEF)-like protein